MPRKENGKPDYVAVEPEVAWDAMVEASNGEEAKATNLVNGYIKFAKAALEKAKKAKIAETDDIDAYAEAEAQRQEAIDRAQAQLEAWQRIADEPARRASQAQEQARAEAQRQTDEAKAQARAEAEAKRAQQEAEAKAQEEAERQKREALNGVPDMVDDSPADARARGYRRTGSAKVDRQQPIANKAEGATAEVKFSDKAIETGKRTIIEASELQPSHVDGQRNPAHFIDEAQPKERKDGASRLAASKMASNIRPEEITGGATAYTGSPCVNSRGEAIQGNNRSTALRLMYESNPEQAQAYKEWLMEHAEEFGMTREQVAQFKQPVLVNMFDVTDERAIELGQSTASDTESGGEERIRPKNLMKKLGSDIKGFAATLLRSEDEDASISELAQKNGATVLKWLNERGHITNTQYQSAFDSKGNLKEGAIADLKGVLYHSIFEGAPTTLEERFNQLPAKAQRAILATMYRDFSSPVEHRVRKEVQQAIMAYDALRFDHRFAKATNITEALKAMDEWSKQMAFDEVSGEAFLPSESFSNFALHLAAMMKGMTQKGLQSSLNEMFDIIQGTQKPDLFGEVDNTPKTLAEAISKVFNIEYKPLKTKDNGNDGSSVLAGHSEDGEAGRRGSSGTLERGERTEAGTEPTDGGRRADSSRGQELTAEKPVVREDNQGNPVDENGKFRYFSGTIADLISKAKDSAIGVVKKLIAPVSSRLQEDLASQGLDVTNEYNHVIDNYAIRHALKQHGEKSEEKRGQVPLSDQDFERIEDVVNNYDDVRVELGKRGMYNIIYSKAYPDGTTIYVEEQHSKHKELAAVSMWKYKKTTLPDAKNTEIPPISGLNGQSTGKDSSLSVEKQEVKSESSEKASEQGVKKAPEVAEAMPGVMKSEELGAIMEDALERAKTEDEFINMMASIVDVSGRQSDLKEIFERYQEGGVDARYLSFYATGYKKADQEKIERAKSVFELAKEAQSYEEFLEKMSEAYDVEEGKADCYSIYQGVKNGRITGAELTASKLPKQKVTEVETREAEKSVGSPRVPKDNANTSSDKPAKVRSSGVEKRVGSAPRDEADARKEENKELISRLEDLQYHYNRTGDFGEEWESSEDEPDSDVDMDTLYDEAQKKKYGIIMEAKSLTEELTDKELSKLARRLRPKLGWEGILDEVMELREKEREKEKRDMQLRERARSNYLSSEPLPKPKGKKRKPFSLHEFADAKAVMQVFKGIQYIPGGYVLSTDCRGIITSKKDFDESLAGRVVDKDGNVILEQGSGTPVSPISSERLARIIPQGTPTATATLTDEALQAGIALPVRKDQEKYIYLGFGDKAVKTKAGTSRIPVVALVDAFHWKRFLRGAQHNGATEIEFYEPTTIVARSENGVVMTMGIGPEWKPSQSPTYRQDLSGTESKGKAKFSIGHEKTPVAGLPNRANEKQASGSVLQSISGDSSSNATASKEADAKVRNNTQSAKRKIRMFSNNDFSVRTDALDKTFEDLGKMFAMRSKGGSRYAVLRTDGGQTVALRLSDHGANGNNFAQDGANQNLSIVIERRRFDAKDSDVEYTEATIPMAVYEANGKAVVEAIVKGVDAVLADKPFELDESLGTVETKGSQKPSAQFNAAMQELEAESPVASEVRQAVYEVAKGLVEASGIEVVEVSNEQAMQMAEIANPDIKLMGSRTERKKQAVADYYSNKRLDENERAVVDVFSGKEDNLVIECQREDGTRKITLRQGSENKAGTTHSLFRHLDAKSNAISLDEIQFIPEVIAKGQRSINGNKVVYDYSRQNGVRLRVCTEIRPNGREVFTNFYSNKKSQSSDYRRPLTGNTQTSAQTSETDPVSANVQNNTVSDKPNFHRTFHGSAANFDAFDHSYMGDGEGAQAYGWGSYVTEVEGIARGYAERIAESGPVDYVHNDPELKGKPYLEDIIRIIKLCQGDLDYALKMSLFNGLFFHPNREEIESWMKKKADEIRDKVIRPKRHLYTVEIPDDTGNNYIQWNEPFSPSLVDELQGAISKEQFEEWLSLRPNNPNDLYDDFSELTDYEVLSATLGSPKEASNILSKLGYVGIKYPAQYRTGGRQDGAQNYVIFNESDLKITDHVQFLRDGQGVVYGWTVGGKVYLNKDAMSPDTPVHEYTHLWDEMVQKKNPALWQRGVELMKQTPLWEKVANDPAYAHLNGDENAIASEVHSRLTGQKGAETLEEMIDSAKGITEKAARISLVERITGWLRDMFKELKATLSEWGGKDLDALTVEDFVNMTLRDLAEGMNPNEHRDATQSDGVRFSAAMSSGKAEFDAVREQAIKDKGKKLLDESADLSDGELNPSENTTWCPSLRP